MNIKELIKSLTGREVMSMPEQTENWLQWYKGDVANFHNYKDYNGVEDVTCKRKTLNMAKKVCEDWANLLMNEKVDVVLGNKEQQQALWDLQSSVHYLQKANGGVEKTFALGNGFFVEGYDEYDKVRLQFVNATKAYPLNIEQDKITECVFVNNDTYKLILQIHQKGETQTNEQGQQVFVPNIQGNYYVRTVIYDKKAGSDEIGDLKKDENIDTGEKIPWFQHYKPNIANNIDINSPLGISIYANSIDALQGIDLAYDGFCEEMRLGKARIFINKKLVNYDENGQTYVFDINQTGFYYLGDSADKQPVTFYNPALRTDGYFNGINNGLKILSSKTGFGENHYRFDASGLATATQVISEQNEKFKSKNKHEIILYDVLVDMNRALMFISNNFTENPVKFDLEQNIEVKFDDSIIEDKEAEKASDRMDLANGTMSKVEYRMKWFNEDEQTAKKKIAEIDAEKQANMTNFFSGE